MPEGLPLEHRIKSFHAFDEGRIELSYSYIAVRRYVAVHTEAKTAEGAPDVLEHPAKDVPVGRRK